MTLSSSNSHLNIKDHTQKSHFTKGKDKKKTLDIASYYNTISDLTSPQSAVTLVGISYTIFTRQRTRFCNFCNANFRKKKRKEARNCAVKCNSINEKCPKKILNCNIFWNFN